MPKNHSRLWLRRCHRRQLPHTGVSARLEPLASRISMSPAQNLNEKPTSPAHQHRRPPSAFDPTTAAQPSRRDRRTCCPTAAVPNFVRDRLIWWEGACLLWSARWREPDANVRHLTTSRLLGASVRGRAWTTGETGASVKSKTRPALMEAPRRILRAGPPPDVGCGVDDDVVYSLGLGQHRHMA
jgi:hypothetical protein